MMKGKAMMHDRTYREEKGHVLRDEKETELENKHHKISIVQIPNRGDKVALSEAGSKVKGKVIH
jgi:hypothetical protein